MRFTSFTGILRLRYRSRLEKSFNFVQQADRPLLGLPVAESPGSSRSAVQVKTTPPGLRICRRASLFHARHIQHCINGAAPPDVLLAVPEAADHVRPVVRPHQDLIELIRHVPVSAGLNGHQRQFIVHDSHLSNLYSNHGGTKFLKRLRHPLSAPQEFTTHRKNWEVQIYLFPPGVPRRMW